MLAIHFNYNLNRKTKVDVVGKPRLKVTYPKFKVGDATVREVKIVRNYGIPIELLSLSLNIKNAMSDKFHIFVYFLSDYVAEIYQTMITTPRAELNSIKDELQKKIPEALHSMFPEKKKKEAAKINTYLDKKWKQLYALQLVLVYKTWLYNIQNRFSLSAYLYFISTCIVVRTHLILTIVLLNIWVY